MPVSGSAPPDACNDELLAQPLRGVVAEGPLTRCQLVAIAVCVMLNMLDGFDILAMSFAAPGLQGAWQLRDEQLGMLLSAGLIGMCVGSLVLGACADRWGRRRIVLFGVLLAGCAMAGAATSSDYSQLLILRMVTGVGIGGTISSVAVLVSEYTPDRWRSAALAVYATGYPVGATVGGALSALAIPHYGWRAAFAIGAAMSLILLPIAWFGLPESLVSGREEGRSPQVREQLRVLISGQNLLIWILFGATMLGFYFVVSWTPRLLSAAGLSAAAGLAGGVLLNLGGIAGCGLFAVAAARWDARRLLL